MTNPIPEKYIKVMVRGQLTIDQAALYLGCGKEYILQLIKKGIIPVIDEPNKSATKMAVRIRKQALDEWMKKQEKYRKGE